MMGALAGFLCWNYPRGQIFLGDSGAYFVGFMYAELAIRLVTRNPDISAWYVVVLAAYPIVDTLIAMYRRGFVRRRPLMAPDALHLHSLVFRRVALPQERRRAAGAPGGAAQRLQDRQLQRANGRVAPRLWLHGLACFALAFAFRDNTPALWLCFAGYLAYYLNRYRSLVCFRRKAAGAAESAAARDADLVKPAP
jgi:UDP-N-acetylmuramyl pentapeptide phosphotransferase/UDP-N-acetylglucosamine-1-phosphate transferase